MKYGSVYVVENQVNQKKYVGQTTNTIPKRMDQHKRCAKNGKCKYMPFINAMRKYGVDKFKVINSWICSSKREMDKLERAKIKELDTKNPEKGYNIRDGGGGMGEEDRKRMSIKMTEIYSDPKRRFECSQRTTEQMKDPLARENLRNKSKGRWQDPKMRRRMSKAIKKAQSRPEVKENMRKAQQEVSNRPGELDRRKRRMNDCWGNEDWRKKQVNKLAKSLSSTSHKIKVSKNTKKQWGNEDSRKTIHEGIKKHHKCKLQNIYGDKQLEVTLPNNNKEVIYRYELSEFCAQNKLVLGNAIKNIKGKISHTKQFRFKELKNATGLRT